MNSVEKNQSWPEKWDRLLAFRMVETLALWEGRLTTREITKAFGVGRQQASKVINLYKDQHPKNLVYDASSKCYHAADDFIPVYTSGAANEYLQQLAHRDDLTSCFATLDINLPNTEVLYSPIRNIKPEILRPIVQAARDSKRVEIDYVSLTTPVSEGRVISPHTIVWSGFRWHVRAYCEKNLDYRDFVLSRITEPPEITLTSEHSVEEDVAWNIKVPVVIRPDSRLSKSQRRVIELDYGMERGKLKLRTRGALVQYLLQTLRVDPHVVQMDPSAQQIYIENLDELQSWLY